ncbi:FkbM family methyltransferase [Fibrella sp. USSR17]
MEYLDMIKRAEFYLKNPAMNKWRKHEFDYKQYLKFSQPWLSKYCFKTVLDIGANIGQSAIAFSLAFPEAKIHSFEPLPDCYDKLKYVAEQLPNVTAHGYALGRETGEISFERNAYSPSSSLLKIARNHINHFPHTGSTISMSVPVVRLDDYISQLSIKEDLLLKIDVQGYEHHVIEGGKQVLAKSKVVIIETSFEVLYDNQPLFNEVYASMLELGFTYMGSFDQLKSPITGQILQQDAIFIKSQRS